MRSTPIVLAVLGLALATAAAEAQTVYGRSAKDTLRFREVTHSEVKMTMPQGEVVVPIDHDATIGVVFLPGDSARAWYDSLRLTVSSPAGLITPETGSLLRKPFALKFDGRGRTAVTLAPEFPEALQGVSDLSHQFDDFFMRLPAQPLKVGLTWTDTSARTDSTGGKLIRINTIANYRVERDTTVGSEAAMYVSVKQQTTMFTDAPVPGQDMRMQSNMTGGDEGYYLFAPKSGRMLGRQRKGQLSGDTVMSGAMGTMSMGQAMSYTSRIDVVK